MAKYDVHFLVDGNDLPTVLEVTQKVCKLQTIKPVEEPKAPTEEKKKTRTFKYANGTRVKGMSGDEVLLEFIKYNARFNVLAIGNEFVKRGFARNSAGPVICRALQKGLIKKVSPGTYDRNTTT
jgi:hypothetical protein